MRPTAVDAAPANILPLAPRVLVVDASVLIFAAVIPPVTVPAAGSATAPMPLKIIIAPKAKSVFPATLLNMLFIVGFLICFIVPLMVSQL